MAQYSNLKAYIEEKIYENGTQAITGDILQDVLKVMTDDLGEFYQMGGVASPSTDPGTPDAKVIYFATEAGTYTNFGDITIEAGEVALLIFETSWTKETLNVLSAANGGVKTANLANGAVTTEKIAGGAVETAKIANSAVTSGKVADGAIGTAKIADGAIDADKIAANAVESAKIKNGAVTEGKINDGAVTADKVAANAVTTAKIADDAVTTAKLNDGAVTEDKIATDAVTSGKVKDGAIGTAKIAAGAVTHAKIGAGAVEESNIKDGAVTSDKIADGAVGSDQLAEGAFSAENLADGSVTTDKLADDAVTAEKIADGAVTAGKFADGSVSTAKLASGAVITEKIGDGMVTRQKLADSSVGTSKIIDGAVTTDKVADGAITDAKLENPVSVSQNNQTLEIGGVEQGALGGVYIEHPEWVVVATDNDGKIFYGVKKDGKFYFGDGCPPQVQEYVLTHKAEIEAELLSKVDKVAGKSLIDADFASCHTAIYNPDWLEVVTDNEGKILEGRKKDGTKVENCDMEYPLRTIGTINNSDYLEVQTDIDGKIIEGTTKKGEKQIGSFEKTTRNLISKISNGAHFFIPQLDTNFVSPISCKIYDGDTEDENVKGLDNAKYIFKLSDLGDAFNIRVKFKIKENLLNQEKIGHIVKCGNLEINAIPTPLTQYTTQVTYGGEQKTMYWPQLAGGITIGNNISSLLSNKNLGEIAFYIKYTGSDNYASVENDGTQFIVKRGADSSTATTTAFSFTTYETVSSLYEALKELNDFEVYFKEIEGRTTDELAIFSECSIKTTCYTAINGQPDGAITEYVDAAPLFIPYAVDNRWHQVEIVKMGDKIYRVCDGSTIVLDYHIYNDYSSLELGGDCLVQFKDLEISQKSSLDAELWQKGGLIVSEVNPFITIFEGHSMVNETTDEAIADSETMATTVDRLYRVFSTMISKGYIPVSLYDIAEFYSSGKTLPKKCFTVVFDDFEYANCLNADFRRVFKELNIKPSLAIISDSNTAITLNGETITKEKAGEICWKNNFYLVSHTRNHRCNTSVKLSDIMDELKQDIYSADKYLIDGMILVYPYGATSLYILSILQFMGYALGINVDEGDYLYRSNIASHSKYNLIRVEIGVRTSLETIFNKII